MFARYLTVISQSPEGKLWASDDGASTAPDSAGGSQPLEEPVPSEEPEPGRSTEGTTPEEGDDDEDVEEDFSDVPFHEHPRFKSLTKRYGKLRRQLSRLRPVADSVKGLDLEGLRVRARVADELQQVLARRPDLRKAYMDALSNADTPAERDESATFDPSTLPFNVDDEVGKYFVQQHRTILELQKQLKNAQGEVGGLRQSQVQSARKVYEGQWRTATESAAAMLPEN